jgi:Uma2 family endonuclease
MTAFSSMPALTSAPAPPVVKRWTVEDYHRMAEMGLLPPGERTELIAGQVLMMAAKGTPHVLALRRARNVFEALVSQLSEPWFVSTQDPIQLDDFSEPEPDLAIVRGDILDYAERHPLVQDLALVVEVADSTLLYDTETKDKLYARSGVPDYWVLDLKNRQLHIFRQPTASGYASHLILAEPSQASPLAFSDSVVELNSLLPPAELQ